MKIVGVQRLRDKVVLFIGYGEAVYLSVDEAEALGHHISEVAAEVKEEDFAQSRFRDVKIVLGK